MLTGRVAMEIRGKRGTPKRDVSWEKSLLQSEHRYHSLIDLSPDGIMVHMDDQIVYVNGSLLKLVKASDPAELLGRSPLDIVHPDFRDRIRARIRQVNETGKSTPLAEQKILCLDGSSVEVEAAGAPVPWQGGTAIQVTLRDITERKRYERELRESELRLRQLAAALPQIVWMARPDGSVEYCNERFFEMTGLPVEKLNDPELLKNVVHPDDQEDVSRRWQHAVATGESYEAEYRFRGKTGGYRWILARALPSRDETGRIVRWFGTCTDIDDKKKAEMALQHAKEQLRQNTQMLEQLVAARTAKLEASNKSMEDFCHSIAHNLRAPLRAMQGFAVALMEDHCHIVDEEGQDYITRINRAASSMDLLIHDLLMYGRLTHEHYPCSRITLEPLWKNVIDQFQSEIKISHAVIETEQLNFRVWANRSILELVFSNLLSNALKFVEERPPCIKIWAEDKKNSVRIRIRDNGIGIDEEHQQRIFVAFERLHTSDAFPGTGIGLALVDKAIERLGGSVGVESAAGKGSCFWVELPKYACGN